MKKTKKLKKNTSRKDIILSVHIPAGKVVTKKAYWALLEAFCLAALAKENSEPVIDLNFMLGNLVRDEKED